MITHVVNAPAVLVQRGFAHNSTKMPAQEGGARIGRRMTNNDAPAAPPRTASSGICADVDAVPRLRGWFLKEKQSALKKGPGARSSNRR